MLTVYNNLFPPPQKNTFMFTYSLSCQSEFEMSASANKTTKSICFLDLTLKIFGRKF